ncbi:MAG: DUF402 domain-containing protein [Lachnospiraceae bacterium]|nr:DUF402 domain-containing protein [Lachnospiraceae bacterium]
MIYPTLFRKRVIPNECIELKNDVILQCNDETIVTSWNALHKRSDISTGYSCYYLKRGYKISKFFQPDKSLRYWYCDIVDYQYDEASNKLVVMDLLADVIIYPDGTIKVVDLDELSDAFDQNLISADLLKKSLLSLNRLLTELYSNGISELEAPIIDNSKS